jgi:hypothetical protein
MLAMPEVAVQPQQICCYPNKEPTAEPHLLCRCAATDMISRTGELVPGRGTTRNFKAAADGRQLHSSNPAVTSTENGSVASMNRLKLESLKQSVAWQLHSLPCVPTVFSRSITH